MINDLITYLLSKAAITAIVGNEIRPDAFAQSDDKTQIVTGIVVESTGHQRFPVLSGAGGLVFETFDIHCQSPKRSTTRALKEAVRLAPLDGYTGAMGNTSVLATTIDEEQDDYEAPYDGGSTGTFLTTLTVTIQYRESLPVYS